MKNKNSIRSLICFILTGIATFILFVGLFASRWDNIVAHWQDTLFVLGLGTLIPILFISGAHFLIKCIRDREALLVLTVVIGILVFLFCLVYYGLVVSDVIRLYEIKIDELLYGYT